MKLLSIIFFIVLISGCISNTSLEGGKELKPYEIVEKGDAVYVDYTGRLENGTVFDSSAGREPLSFIAGSGQMIKGFDSAVIGMKEGEEKTVSIPPEDAYGMPNPANVLEIPISNMPPGTKAGDTLYAGSVPVRVVKIGNETFTIDANHFLAGKTLIFDIKVVKIEKAKE